MENNAEFTRQLFENQNARKVYLEYQENAVTITAAGPSASGKSTLITEVLPPESNKLLGQNIGVTAQTSLIRTKLMLNSCLDENIAIIQAKERKDSVALDFQRIYVSVLTEMIYAERDDLEVFQLDESAIESILDPVDRSYHAYRFTKECGLTQKLLEILNQICQEVINTPEQLDKAAERRFKELRVKMPKMKKQEVYTELVEQRIFEQRNLTHQLNQWLDDLKEAVRNTLSYLWTDPEKYILIDKIAEDSQVGRLIREFYKMDSACSILFDELDYSVSPSEEFRNIYIKKYKTNRGRAMKLNILDTVGLTQTSQSKDLIGEAMDNILNQKMDALLFLCSADERPTVYQECIELLKERQKKLEHMPVTICRTKADIVLRNILMNEWRKDKGSNIIPEDSQEYQAYALRALKIFEADYLDFDKYGERSIGKKSYGRKIEYLSLAPDLSRKLNKSLEDRLDDKYVFEILLDIAKEVDNLYSAGTDRPWLQTKDLLYPPIEVAWGVGMDGLLENISQELVINNSREKKQYLQYVTSNEPFNGRSVTTFIKKLSFGEGHETKAVVYGNFKLFLKSMVLKWLRNVMPKKEIINCCVLNFNYLNPDNSEANRVKEEFPSNFQELVAKRWEDLLDHIAKRLCNDCLQKELNQCFLNRSWDEGFRDSLKLFNQKFDDSKYWKEALHKSLQLELGALLQKMYIFDI
jgi:energy-coupling factor transporter ATP-binding protein EcfA2